MGSLNTKRFSPKPFSGQLIDEQIHTIGGANLHRHIEGVLSHRNLASICRGLDLLIGKNWAEDERFWTDVGAYMYSGKTRTFAGFASRLSTRWMRLILIAGMLEGRTGSSVLQALVARILEKTHREGMRYVDFLACPLALTGEHLLHPPQHASRLFPEERQIFARWEKAQRKISKELLLTTRSYFEAIRSAVTAVPEEYTWATEKKPHRFDCMEVGVRFCVRRDQAPEQALKGSQFSKDALNVLEDIRALYHKGLIVGVDMAGNESLEGHRLRTFEPFLRAAGRMGVPITVHAGELKKDLQELAYDNLHFAIEELGVARIGHAVRLFDNEPRMQKLLHSAIEKGIFFEVNLTSNEWTGVAPDVSLHPILAALRGEHPTRVDRPELFKKLRTLVIFCDDDPVIAGNSPHPVVDEIVKACAYTDNLGFDTPEELITTLLGNAKQALLWKS